MTLEETTYALDFDFPDAVRLIAFFVLHFYHPTDLFTRLVIPYVSWQYWIDAVPRALSAVPSQENDFPESFGNININPDAPPSQTSSDRRRQHLLDEHYQDYSGGPSDDPSNRDEFLEFGPGGIDLQLDDWDAGVVPPPTEGEEFGFQALPQQDDMNMDVDVNE